LFAIGIKASCFSIAPNFVFWRSSIFEALRKFAGLTAYFKSQASTALSFFTQKAECENGFYISTITLAEPKGVVAMPRMAGVGKGCQSSEFLSCDIFELSHCRVPPILGVLVRADRERQLFTGSFLLYLNRKKAET